MTTSRCSSGKKDAHVDLNRVVTPMLDMSFQILFFLIMSFRLPTAEGQVPLLLPKEPAVQDAQSIPLGDEDQEYRLRLYATAKARDLGSLAWKPKKTPTEIINSIDPADEKDARLKKLDPLLYGLAVKLKEVRPKDGDPAPAITIECDRALRYSEVLRVMDVLRQFRFDKINVRTLGKD